MSSPALSILGCVHFLDNEEPASLDAAPRLRSISREAVPHSANFEKFVPKSKRFPILLTFDETTLILYTVASPSLNFNFTKGGDP